MFAAKHGKMDAIKMLIKVGANPNVQNNDGITALMLAAYGNKSKIISELLKSGADPGKEDYLKQTAFLMAIKQGHSEAVQALGGSEDVLNDLLYKTVTYQDMDFSKYLLKVGANSNKVFAVIVNSNNLENDDITNAIKTLVQLGVNLEALNEYGFTALMIAIMKGNLHTVKQLLAAGADPTTKNFLGYTAFIFAITHQRISIIEHLMNQDIPYHDFKSALTKAVQYNGLPDAKQVLIADKAKLNAYLLQAIERNDSSFSQVLITAGADPNAQDEYEWTALMLAVYAKAANIVSQLLEAGANYSACHETNDFTALSLAEDHGYKDCIRLLKQAQK